MTEDSWWSISSKLSDEEKEPMRMSSRLSSSGCGCGCECWDDGQHWECTLLIIESREGAGGGCVTFTFERS